VAEAEPVGGQISVLPFPPAADTAAAGSDTDAKGPGTTGSSDGVAAASANTATSDSGSSDQASIASTGSTVPEKKTPDLAADTSNDSADMPLSSASVASDPSTARVSGVGKDFPAMPNSESGRRVDMPIGDPRKASSAATGIATTSMVTSAMASQVPSRTMSGAGKPSISVTTGPRGFFNALADAFKDPVRRTQSIGILVAVVVGFILIVALIVFLWYCLRRRKKDAQKSDISTSGDGEKGELSISGPINQTTQEEIANYDPSAEIMADSAGLNYGPSQPSQLDNALVNRASRLSASRKSFLDIYGGANTPYPQDVVDGTGKPLTQQFLMPDADKFQDVQVKGLGPLSPFDPKVPGLGSADASSSHQRNTSAESNLSNLPEDVNPNQPAPFAGQEGPMSPIDPSLSRGRFQNPQTQPMSQDPFSDDNIEPLPPLGAAAIRGNMKSQPRKPQRKGPRQRTDSWMTVNTAATTRAAAPPTTVGNAPTRQPSRTDYTSVYMRNPFIDPPEGPAGVAPPVPAMPLLPAHFRPQQGASRREQTESVTLMISPHTVPAPPQYPHQQVQRQQQRPLSGPGDTEDMYGGVLDDYPPRPPSTQAGIALLQNRAYGEGSFAYAGGGGGVRRSNPFDLEVDDDVDGAGGGGAGFTHDGTVNSVQSWLSGVAEAERDRMQRGNVI
jgi:hypothetical protein